jgi:signal transduction histidine kinase
VTAAGELQDVSGWRSVAGQAAGMIRRFPDRLQDRRFWLIQGMVLTIVALHGLFESQISGPLLESLHEVPVFFFVIPVVYASLNFGWEGGLLTGAWCALLTVPNELTWHRADYAWVGEFVETMMIVLVGTVLGWRVERERRLRQHLQYYASELLRAQEAERLRVARDIHDDTIQSLALLCRGLDRVLEECERKETAIEIVRDLREQANAAVDSARRFCADLRPAILDDLGLAAGIQWLIRDLGERTGIDASLQITGDKRRLERETELVVFRIMQEVLRNVEKHANAAHVRAKVHFAHDGISMQVQDDGVGFVLSAMDRIPFGEHLGLTGMRERARVVGGEVTIKTRPARGTTVSVFVPERVPVSEPGQVG